MYCKNCGAKLNDSSVGKAGNFGSNATPFAAPAPQTQKFGDTLESMGGIPISDVEAFTGSTSITAEFSRMEKTGSKVSWCLPAALLGFLLGPAGSAIWFFRRKMVKIALLLLAVGTLLFTLNSALGTVTYQPSDSSDFLSISEAYVNGETDISEYLKSLAEFMFGGYTIPYVLLTFLGNAVNGATGVLCGLFGNYAYKKHTVNRIQKYRAANVDQRYYQLGLSTLGGTSGGLTALGIIGVWAMFLVANAVLVFLGG